MKQLTIKYHASLEEELPKLLEMLVSLTAEEELENEVLLQVDVTEEAS